MEEGKYQFSLRRLFLWVTVVAAILGGYAGFFALLRRAQHAAEQSAYGKKRFTRVEAEAIAGRPLDNLSDDEFRDK
jgi:hypothetical protein